MQLGRGLRRGRPGLEAKDYEVLTVDVRLGRGGARFSAESAPPARLWHRSGGFALGRCRNAPSGEKTTPEQGFPTGFRTRHALRRVFDAGSGSSDGIPYEARPPARNRRRKGRFVRDRCGNAPSGAEMTPGRGFHRASRPSLSFYIGICETGPTFAQVTRTAFHRYR